MVNNRDCFKIFNFAKNTTLIKFSGNTLRLFKIFVVVAAYGFVFFKLYGQINEGVLSQFSKSEGNNNWCYLVIIVLLMPIAWGFEAIKWQLSFNKKERPHFIYALKTIWYGVGVGLFTPNRTGEPIGRMAMVPHDIRGKAAVLSILCGMTQQLATLLFGFVGLAFLVSSFKFKLSSTIYNPWVISFLAIATIAVLFLVFKFRVVLKFLTRIEFIKRILHGESIVFYISSTRVLALLSLSFIRYAVFTTQFVILLYYFGFNGNILSVYAAVFATYLFASVIPSLAIGEAGVRAGFAILFIGAIWNSPMGIAAATLLIWILNVALPGLVAVWFPLVNGKRDLERG
ncbi:MAG: lysylphosphatidylglycerol synthase domain-containing protein [Bacteroidales bacterium]